MKSKRKPQYVQGQNLGVSEKDFHNMKGPKSTQFEISKTQAHSTKTDILLVKQLKAPSSSKEAVKNA